VSFGFQPHPDGGPDESGSDDADRQTNSPS